MRSSAVRATLADRFGAKLRKTPLFLFITSYVKISGSVFNGNQYLK
jgi:hypothetical protein